MKSKLKEHFKKQKNLDYIAKCNYVHYYEKNPIKSNTVLLESRHGKEFNGIIFRIAHYLSTSLLYKDFEIVIVADTDHRLEQFRNKLDINGMQRVQVVRIMSDDYLKCISIAKYLINDTSFLPFYIKKEGQIYLNTWHGTPLKTLGRKVVDEAYFVGNVQYNFMVADYILFPNKFTKDCLIDDYMIQNITHANGIYCGYPRNEVFFENSSTKREKFIVENDYLKVDKIYAYLPTYRGAISKGHNSIDDAYLLYYLCELDKVLNDNELVLLNLHPISKKMINFTDFKHIKEFPSDYDTYDVLSIVDVLITDYSSVMFDFACSRKKIVLFTFDEDRYLEKRGVNFSLDKLPFPRVHSVTELTSELRTAKHYDDSKFLDYFCKYDCHKATQKLCDTVILDCDCGLEVFEIDGNGKENVIIYAGNLANNGITKSLCNLVNLIDVDKRNYFISFNQEKIVKNNEVLKLLPENVYYYAITGRPNFTIVQRVIRELFRHRLITAKLYYNLIKRALEYEMFRTYGFDAFDYFIQFNGYEDEMQLLFNIANKNAIFVHNNMLKEIKIKGNQRKDVLRLVYRKYCKVAIVTKDLYKSTLQLTRKNRDYSVVNNCIDYSGIIENSLRAIRFDSYTKSNFKEEKIKQILEDESSQIFINIGRFSPEKGHKRLVDAFFKVWKNSNKKPYLFIIGGVNRNNGYERLCEYVDKIGIIENVIIILNMSNPYPILKKCNYFVFSSFYEGFGLVVVEADILGIPVISTDVCGVREFMKENGGFIVDDSEEGLVYGMNQALQGKVIKMKVDYKKYNDTALKQFEELFE